MNQQIKLPESLKVELPPDAWTVVEELVMAAPMARVERLMGEIRRQLSEQVVAFNKPPAPPVEAPPPQE
jgi:hypothetical protein